MTELGPVTSMKASCFSAVIPVMGWNQWAKWVAPFSMAHFAMAWATVLAVSMSRMVFSWMASMILS